MIPKQMKGVLHSGIKILDRLVSFYSKLTSKTKERHPTSVYVTVVSCPRVIAFLQFKYFSKTLLFILSGKITFTPFLCIIHLFNSKDQTLSSLLSLISLSVFLSLNSFSQDIHNFFLILHNVCDGTQFLEKLPSGPKWVIYIDFGPKKCV